MTASPYRVSRAQIGNFSGLRLPAAFCRGHPHIQGAPGQVEVLGGNTLLLRLEPQVEGDTDPEDETLLLGLFLDFLTRQALRGDHGPRLYAETMAADDEALLAGVEVDNAEPA